MALKPDKWTQKDTSKYLETLFTSVGTTKGQRAFRVVVVLISLVVRFFRDSHFPVILIGEIVFEG